MRVAAAIAEVPTAAINLIDLSRQSPLATVGFDGADSPRDESMCAIQFRTGRFVHVADCFADPIYASNPWVTGERGDVRFYASAPLITPEGYVLGTLCVFDAVARSLRPDQASRLLDLADVIVALFERRRHARATADLAAAQERTTRLLETVMDTIDVGLAVTDADGQITSLNRAAQSWHGVAEIPLSSDQITLRGPDGAAIKLAAHRVVDDCDDVIGTVVTAA
ncbi:GAF domain-containing protein [Actinoplanes sp. CA-142083]|uniref:GAF domain-containing protein n=1 Tax=Actinoplanes sp. CA-142083 TaxID=3239903 RepID=UPI003D9399A9